MRAKFLSRILAITVIATAAQHATAQAQEEQRYDRLQNVILVHGAWADGTAWSKVIHRLQKSNINVVAVQLGLNNLDEDVAAVRRVLEAEPGPTLVVAHSYAGAVVSRLGKDVPNLAGIVFESAFAPDQGENLKALYASGTSSPGLSALKTDGQGYVWMDQSAYVRFFAPDIDTDKARVLAATQKPIASKVLFDETPYGWPAWRSVPTWFIVTTEDQVVPVDAQRAFAKRMGAVTEDIDGSHASMISHDEHVADFIRRAAHEANVRRTASATQ